MPNIRPRIRSYFDRTGKKLVSGGQRFHSLGEKIYLTTEERETIERKRREAKWYGDGGDQTHRVNYPLDNTSVVLDIGGYHGDWARDIYCMYGSKIHIFEPVGEFIDIIKARFGDNPDIHIHEFGLSNKNTVTNIFLAEGGTSTIKETADSTKVKLVKASDFLTKAGIKKIDLVKINIEGGEYDLLEHLMDEGLIEDIKDIQVQFHIFVPDAEERVASILKRLARTHRLTYQYPWVWDNWRLKNER